MFICPDVYFSSSSSDRQRIKKNSYSNKMISNGVRARTHIAESELARRKRTHGSIPSNQRTLASGYETLKVESSAN